MPHASSADPANDPEMSNGFANHTRAGKPDRRIYFSSFGPHVPEANEPLPVVSVIAGRSIRTDPILPVHEVETAMHLEATCRDRSDSREGRPYGLFSPKLLTSHFCLLTS